MGKQSIKTAVLLILILTLVITGCSSGNGTSNKKKDVDLPASIAEKDQLKLMVIRKIGGDDHTAQFLAGAKQEGEAMGFKVDTFSANSDSAQFHDALAQALDKNYDGIIISHGDDAATVEQVQKFVDKGIPVVTFDSIPDLAAIEGVTLTSQDDEGLAQLALDQLVAEVGTEANIIYLWVDGFPPMVRRNVIYQNILDANPGIKELERFGVAAEDTSVQTQNAVAAMLTKYPKGEIDAIFAAWDAFAIGAARALNEAGRNEIKIYSIDVSNADLQLIQEEGSSWAATAAVDPKMIGALNVRILLNKIAGEETPQTYDLEATLITQEKLNASGKEVNMINLAEIIPGWGQSDAFETDWMKALKESK